MNKKFTVSKRRRKRKREPNELFRAPICSEKKHQEKNFANLYSIHIVELFPFLVPTHIKKITKNKPFFLLAIRAEQNIAKFLAQHI